VNNFGERHIPEILIHVSVFCFLEVLFSFFEVSRKFHWFHLRFILGFIF
jgi:hypothetical protein